MCACTPSTRHPGGPPGSSRLGDPRATGLNPRSTSGNLGSVRRTGPWTHYHLERWQPPLTIPAVVLDVFGGTGTTAAVARNPAVAYGLEDEFRALGIRVHAADEPFEESFASIVLRHVNVGLARGTHFELMKKSREGSEANIRQGWHGGGIAPYGYQLTPMTHPNPHKARQGLVKYRMQLDPVRAPVVRRADL